jgi:hypothetical protein
MTGPPTCQYRDPDSQKVCGVEVTMPTMRADGTLGPTLCPEHTRRVNEDRDSLRSRVPDGWEAVDEQEGPALILRRLDGRLDTFIWDPLAGITVNAFLEGLPI